MKTVMFKISLILILLLISMGKAVSGWEVVNTFQAITHGNFEMVSIDTNTYLLNANRHYLIGYPDEQMSEGLIFYLTKDYGKTWDSVFSTIKPLTKEYKVNTLEGMQAISKDTIFLMISLEKNNAMLAKTYDGGKSWDSLFCPFARSSALASITPIFYFKNSKEGYYALTKDFLWVTNDGGVSWKSMELPKFNEDPDYNGYSISNFDISSNNFLITAVRDHNDPKWKKLFISKDWGKSWKVINDDSDTIEYGTQRFFYRSENEIWGLGFNPDNKRETVIRKSTDDGQTWERIDKGAILGGQGLNIHFFSQDSIILQTQWLLLKSIDNGKSWVEYYEDNPQHNTLFAVTITGWDKGLLVHQKINGENIMQCNAGPANIEQINNKNLVLYPNPIAPNQTLNISFSNNIPLSDCKINIIDINGKLVDEYSLVNFSSEINMQYTPETPFACGAYFLVIESSGNIIAKERFIVK